MLSLSPAKVLNSETNSMYHNDKMYLISYRAVLQCPCYERIILNLLRHFIVNTDVPAQLILEVETEIFGCSVFESSL